ncbi:hypothetical protein Pla100_06700 [Neorhodopirellula pilleata]|uniref:Segregation and condensation protein B n=2 Tax=Neorhodopirellula pilleata TaxID=2714738 RepID=A0A5C6AVH2_9BACT|nr:hypothetical protein Pla100_06700 [Neorhodopirellula pilleata]
MRWHRSNSLPGPLSATNGGSWLAADSILRTAVRLRVSTRTAGTKSLSDRPENHDGDVAQARDSREPLDRGLARCRVEALLLIAKSPLNYRRLASLADLEDATQARTLVAELNDLYDSNGRGIRIEQIAGGSRMMTRAVVSPWLRKLGVLPPAIRLSWPMMETLAIVAYRQDVTRADVEAVRGVACGEILRQLMSLDLVRISGRSEDLGRPYLYGTTKRFLQICGLASINALPAIDSRGFCDDVSGSPDVADSSDDSPFPPSQESDTRSGSPVSKESDVSIALTDALATDSVLSTFATTTVGESLAAPVASPLDPSAVTDLSDAVAVIEDEEDDLFEKGLEDDEEEFVDDDEDWDDDDEEDDEEEDDLEDEDESEEDEVEDEADASWEEVDDDEADEDWEDEEEDDDDWEEDDDEEEEEEDEEWDG